MFEDRLGGRNRDAMAESQTPRRPLSVWVDPGGNAHDCSGDEPVPTGRTLDELAVTHDGLGAPIAVMATGWRLFHARPRPATP